MEEIYVPVAKKKVSEHLSQNLKVNSPLILSTIKSYIGKGYSRIDMHKRGIILSTPTIDQNGLSNKGARVFERINVSVHNPKDIEFNREYAKFERDSSQNVMQMASDFLDVLEENIYFKINEDKSITVKRTAAISELNGFLSVDCKHSILRINVDEEGSLTNYVTFSKKMNYRGNIKEHIASLQSGGILLGFVKDKQIMKYGEAFGYFLEKGEGENANYAYITKREASQRRNETILPRYYMFLANQIGLDNFKCSMGEAISTSINMDTQLKLKDERRDSARKLIFSTYEQGFIKR